MLWLFGVYSTCCFLGVPPVGTLVWLDLEALAGSLFGAFLASGRVFVFTQQAARSKHQTTV